MINNYTSGKIYTLRCKDDENLVYVGSTINLLSARYGRHKYNSKKDQYKNNKLYSTINGCWDRWFIQLEEKFPCNSKEELEEKEGIYIREIANLNSHIPGREDKERRKQYYQNNKDKILQYRKEYYQKKKLIKHDSQIEPGK